MQRACANNHSKAGDIRYSRIKKNKKMNSEKIDFNKWVKVAETENFVKFQEKKKWLVFSVTNTQDVFELCEIFRSKGYVPHLSEYPWDGSIIFERITNTSRK